MDPEDDGKFHYNLNYAPLCVKPPEHQLLDCKEVMKTAIGDYLQTSCKLDVARHENAMLDSGLMAGEAGVIFFRDANTKRRKGSSQEFDARQAILIIQNALRDQMGIVVDRDDATRNCFHRYITSSIFESQNVAKQLNSTLKCFLKESGLKAKGYTSKLRRVVEQIDRDLITLHNSSMLEA